MIFELKVTGQEDRTGKAEINIDGKTADIACALAAVMKQQPTVKQAFLAALHAYELNYPETSETVN